MKVCQQQHHGVKHGLSYQTYEYKKDFKIMMKIGFYLVGILLVIYGILGLLNIEVWIRNQGWVHLSLAKSIFFLIFGLLLLAYIKTLKNNKNS